MDTDVVKLQQGIAVDVAAMVAPLLDAQGAEPSQKVVVMADPRSNSVLLRSSSPAAPVWRGSWWRSWTAPRESGNLHVVYLRNAQANQLAGVLRGVVAGRAMRRQWAAMKASRHCLAMQAVPHRRSRRNRSRPRPEAMRWNRSGWTRAGVTRSMREAPASARTASRCRRTWPPTRC